MRSKCLATNSWRCPIMIEKRTTFQDFSCLASGSDLTSIRVWIVTARKQRDMDPKVVVAIDIFSGWSRLVRKSTGIYFHWKNITFIFNILACEGQTAKEVDLERTIYKQPFCPSILERNNSAGLRTVTSMSWKTLKQSPSAQFLMIYMFRVIIWKTTTYWDRRMNKHRVWIKEWSMLNV